MSGSSSASQASCAVQGMLKRSLSGSPTSAQEHLGRAQLIAERIWQRWHVGPWQWRLKHVRWFLERRTGHLRPGTRYKYWLTMVKVLEARKKADAWRGALAGPWTSAKVATRVPDKPSQRCPARTG